MSLPTWTPTRLLRFLRQQLNHPEVHLQFTKLHTEVAVLNYQRRLPYKNITISIDEDQGSRISSLIHELLHLVWLHFFPKTENKPQIDRELEEMLVAGLENELNQYILNSPRQLAGWRRAIDQKLRAQEQENGAEA